MKRSIITTLLCTATLFMPVMAQTTWGLRGSIGLEKKITKGFDAAIEAKYHQTDNFSKTDRWSVGVSLDKRLYRNFAKTFSVKASVGYKYLTVYNDWSTKYKGDETNIPDDMEPQYYINGLHNFNLNNSYTDHRHRATAAVQAALQISNFKLTWREAYPYTYTDSAQYSKDKYRYKNNAWKPVETVMDGKSPSCKQILRSRIGLDYDIPGSRFEPFMTYELFSNIDDNFKIQKSRITAGTDFNLNKKHSFELAYLWQNNNDEDEPAGSYICIGYKFKF